MSTRIYSSKKYKKRKKENIYYNIKTIYNKNGDYMKKALIVVSIILVVLIIIGGIVSLLISNMNTHIIHYKDGSSNYDIILKNNKVIVKSKITVECIKAPCKSDGYMTQEIKFTKENDKIIKEWIKYRTNKKRIIKLTNESVNNEEKTIINSIVKNNEKILEMKEQSGSSNQDNMYTVITDLKWKTTQNDGGSYTSHYYIIDIYNKKVTKKEEIYNAPKNTHKKTIEESVINKTKNILDKAISNTAEEKNVDDFYTIKHNNIESYIYNREKIDELESILLELDYY